MGPQERTRSLRCCKEEVKMGIFVKVKESDITAAILDQFMRDFKESLQSDVLVVGAGPAGLVAAWELAKQGYKVTMVEHNNYLGGGMWIGGYLMSPITIREPGQRILEELDVKVEKVKDGLYVARGPEAVSKLIAAACNAGVKVINMTRVEDAVLRGGRVEGAVINWTPVKALPRAITCVDPVAIEARVVIDASGHDAVVCQALRERGVLEFKTCGAMWVEEAEDVLVEKTGEVFPGLVLAGMSVSTYYGTPRMGPTFGGMLFSGRKAASETMRILE